MTLTIEKKYVDIHSLKVWITSNYDFLETTNERTSISAPYRFDVLFGKDQYTHITLKETIIKPLNCKLSDNEYFSEQQCLVNIFITEHFPACPIKCLPIQMKGFRYRGFSPYATFGTWKKTALAKFLSYVCTNKINSP